ncbi:MAG: acyl-CoA dehydrogenase family protein [Burkholderiales bacterium]
MNAPGRPGGIAPTLTPDSARGAAAALVPKLIERAARCEGLRRCPDETIADLYASGLMRIMQPPRYGGSGLGLESLLDITLELSRGCGSSAWVALNLISHSWNIGQLSIQAQDDVWGENPNAVAATSFAFPCGKARAVDGGYRLAGRWPFASGVDSAQWMLVGALTDRGTGAPERRFFLVPMADYKSLDDWHAYGLAGTGSHNVEMNEAFVPEHRTANAEAFARGFDTPGGIAHGTSLYRTPPFPGFAFALGMLPVGSARAACAEHLAMTRSRAGTYSGVRLAELAPMQIRIAEASAAVDLAVLSLRTDVREFAALVDAGTSPSVETRMRWRRNLAFGAGLAVRAVDTLMAASGAGGLTLSNSLQRHFRDVHAGGAHITLTWDVQASAYGLHALGLGVPAGMIL